MGTYYILKDKKPVPVSFMEWVTWFERAERIIKQEEINGIKVSTVFLGMNHSFGYTPNPLVFETMIFGGEHDEYCERYSTWDEAEDGHQRAVDIVNGKQKY